MSEDYQRTLEGQVDGIIDTLERASAAGVELDPLTTILQRLAAKGTEVGLDDLPPMLRLMLAGMQA